MQQPQVPTPVPPPIDNPDTKLLKLVGKILVASFIVLIIAGGLKGKFLREEKALVADNNITVDKYKTYLDQDISKLYGHSVGYDDTAFGPAEIQASLIAKNVYAYPGLTLNFTMVNVPNILYSENATHLVIDKVLSTEGENIYRIGDAPSAGSDAVIHLTKAYAETNPMLKGSRNVFLTDGSYNKKISSIEGRLVLALPLDIQAVRFYPNEIGKTKNIGNVSITLVEMGNDKLAFLYSGPSNSYVGTKVRQKTDDLYGDSTYPQLAENADNVNKKVEYDFHFPGFTSSMEYADIMIAGSIYKAEYPFIIKDQYLNYDAWK